MKTVRDILNKPANEISESMNIDINSKRIKFIDHLYALIYSALHKYDLTDTSIDNGISKSWLSKLNNNKSFIPFIEPFYKLLKPYKRAHGYRVYGRYMRVLAIDSTSLNGMIIQIFSYITEYIIVNMIMESIGIMVSFPELIRGIRHGNISYFNNIYNLDLSKI